MLIVAKGIAGGDRVGYVARMGEERELEDESGRHGWGLFVEVQNTDCLAKKTWFQDLGRTFEDGENIYGRFCRYLCLVSRKLCIYAFHVMAEQA